MWLQTEPWDKHFIGFLYVIFITTATMDTAINSGFTYEETEAREVKKFIQGHRQEMTEWNSTSWQAFRFRCHRVGYPCPTHIPIVALAQPPKEPSRSES